MARRISHIAEVRKLLPPDQHGFRKGHRTTDGLISLVEYIRLNWKKKQATSALTLDLAGAYDNVCHVLLLGKLKKMNFPRYISDWLKNYLSNRTTVIDNNGICSDMWYLQQGLP